MYEQAYEFIKNKIMMCEYAPGAPLSESFLQKELGFSRTPVRESISRLAQEGLVKVFPKQGIVVSSFSIADVNKIFEVRILVEPYALLTYGEKISRSEIERFHTIFQNYDEHMKQDEYFRLDDEFHLLLVSTMQNEYLRSLYETIRVQNTRLRILSGRNRSQRMVQTFKEHMDITTAALKDDFAGASEALRNHLVRSRSSSFNTILENNADIASF